MSTTAERGLVKQQNIDGQIVTRTAETAQAATAEQAKAMVQARFMVALNRPRNYEDSRLAILKTCKRPTFAVKARYRKPQSGARSCGRKDCPHGYGDFCDNICGLSIRAADEFAKFYGNIQTEQATLYDDNEQRIVGVAATDLEHNITKSVQLCIKKTVERKRPGDRTVIEWRENSKGEQVAVVQATDDELMQKEGALCAKARRNLLLQLIPADLLEEAEDEAFDTVARGITDDPEASKKKLIASFDALGIKPSGLEAYLGHSLDGISVAEVADLQCVYSAVADREAKWSDFLKASEGGDDEHSSRMQSLKEKARQKIDKKRNGTGQSREPASNKAYATAYATLNNLYNDFGPKIDAALSSAVGMEMQDLPRETDDPGIINAIIAVAEEVGGGA